MAHLAMDDQELSKLLFLAGLVIVVSLLGITALWISRRKTLVGKLSTFFGEDSRNFTSTSRSFNGLDFPNVHKALESYAKSKNGSIETIGHGGYGLRYLDQDMNLPGSKTAAVKYESVDIGYDERMQVPKNCIYLITTGDNRFACEVSFSYEAGNAIDLIVISREAHTSAAFLEEIRELVCTQSVYKGKILSLEGQETTADIHGWMKIRFHEFPVVDKSEIILPSKTLDLIERNVSSFYRHSQRLLQAGKSLKRGVLFYGKPGTGKTFTAKYLSQHLEGVTVFLLSGEQLWIIKEAFQLARLLAPSLVIMEDVDLIAHTRDETLGQTVLHQLLNELDGLTRETEIIFLLTTNRPEVLEPALSLRPGRIDQAIKFPLPDADCRQRLIVQYAEGLDLEVDNMSRLIDRTDGGSPAFIQELMRKAALIAAENMPDPEGNGKLTVTDDDIHRALDELLLSGPLTKSLVGFHPRPQGMDD